MDARQVAEVLNGDVGALRLVPYIDSHSVECQAGTNMVMVSMFPAFLV